MYNQDIKERFLKECYKNEETREIVALTFAKVEKLEIQFETDLMNVSLPQLESILRKMRAANKNSLGKSYNYMQKYYEWAYRHRLCGMNLAFSNISRKDLAKYLNIDKLQNQYITRDEMYALNLVNAVDHAIIALLFEGLNGENMIELRFLAKNEVKIIDREIYVTSGNSPRVLTNIDERTIDILQEAISTNEYLNANGDAKGNAPKRYMIGSPYVLRPTKMHNKDGEPMSEAGINVKFKNIRSWTKKYYINPTSVFYSGVFERLGKIQQDHELTNNDYRNVLTQVGMNPDTYGMLKERYETYLSLK